MAQVTLQSETQTRPAEKLPWQRRTGVLAALGGVLLWAALPPLGLGLLAWIAPVPWLLLVRREGGRPYRVLWLAGFCFWLAAIHWLRLPHWTTYFGWLALSAYLAFYLPVFVGLTRVAVHRLRISVIVAAPVVWTGLEFTRAHLLSGFLMASLAHTQVDWPSVIQISDLAGGYAVTFVLMLVAACLARAWPHAGRRFSLWPLAAAAIVLAATLAYGHWRLGAPPGAAGPRVALIQGSIDAEWKEDRTKNQRIFDQYFGLSQQAVHEASGELDLIVWPETMYRNALYRVDPDFQPAADVRALYREADEETASHLADMAHVLRTPLLIGIGSIELRPSGPVAFNSAVGIARDGAEVGLYNKVHRVMFGEYIPLAHVFPWLYELTPLAGGLEAGEEPKTFLLGDYLYASNICYESTVPHVIRNQVQTLTAAGEEPDVLVNLTNDAWFWGSSELDMHLACGVFRAIECRKPFLIAANTGISAQIDSSGRILQQSPKQQTDVLLAQVTLDPRRSPYLIVGDWPAGACLAGCVLLAVLGLIRGRRG